MKILNKRPKNSKSNSTNKTPKFFTYSIIYKKISKTKYDKNKNNHHNQILFRCNKCFKTFTNFSHLKRHVLQVEFRIKKKCSSCGKLVKRMGEHKKKCKKLSVDLNEISKNSKKKNIITQNNEKKNQYFDMNFIIANIIDDLKLKNNYEMIKNKYLYFTTFVIGEGSFGAVAFGVKLDDNTPIAAKIQLESNGKDFLKREKDILCSFPNNYPFSKFIYHETNVDGNLLMESLVGPNLDKLYKFCNYSFDIPTICNIGKDLITCFELIHNLGYCHNDLKSDNIALLLQNIENEISGISIITIDFGKTRKFATKKEISNTKSSFKRLYGNVKFSSYNSLNGGVIGPKDDLESMCYLLLFYYKNSLPWSNISRKDKEKYKNMVLNAKKNFNFKKYCGTDFMELVDIFTDIKGLRHLEKPNYSKYKSLFEKAINKHQNLTKNCLRFKWQLSFYNIIKEFLINHNYQLLNDSIKLLFEGYPEQLGFSFINQYYYYYKKIFI